jgi:hypothetical protein
LMKAFFCHDDPCKDWGRLLDFLSPTTITGGLAIKGFS